MRVNYVKHSDIEPPNQAWYLISQGKYGEAIDELERRRTDIHQEVRILYDAVLRLRPPICIEAGTRQGESTTAIMAALAQTGGELYSVDINPVTVPKLLRKNPKWHFTQCDAADYGRAWVLGRVKFLFIDTSHYFNDTVRELEVFLPMLEVGGESYWHDTMEPWHVTGAIKYHDPEGRGYSVKEVGGRLAGMAKIRRER